MLAGQAGFYPTCPAWLFPRHYPGSRRHYVQRFSPTQSLVRTGTAPASLCSVGRLSGLSEWLGCYWCLSNRVLSLQPLNRGHSQPTPPTNLRTIGPAAALNLLWHFLHPSPQKLRSSPCAAPLLKCSWGDSLTHLHHPLGIAPPPIITATITRQAISDAGSILTVFPANSWVQSGRYRIKPPST